MSGVRKGGNHAMIEVSTHRAGPPEDLNAILEKPFNEIRDKAIQEGVFRVGMNKEDLAKAVLAAEA